MTEPDKFWLYEAGIGENRAMLVARGECLKICLEREDSGVRVGAVVDGKFSSQWIAGRSGIVTLPSGQECLLQPLPVGLTEGATVRLEIVRSALVEKGGQSKRAKAKPAKQGALLAEGPDLLERLEASRELVEPVLAHQKDRFAQYGWHEMIEQAETGQIDFEGGRLLISPTPAMTVIDVDGPLAPLDLSKRAAKQVAMALSRFNITGSVAVDFPTLAAKADRTEVSGIFADHMAENCEQTAINGFGLMQVVSQRIGPSILEIVQKNRALNATLQLLRQAERSDQAGGLKLEVHPGIAALLSNKQSWLDALAKRTGRKVAVVAKGSVSINGGQITSH